MHTNTKLQIALTRIYAAHPELEGKVLITIKRDGFDWLFKVPNLGIAGIRLVLEYYHQTVKDITS